MPTFQHLFQNVIWVWECWGVFYFIVFSHLCVATGFMSLFCKKLSASEMSSCNGFLLEKSYCFVNVILFLNF